MLSSNSNKPFPENPQLSFSFEFVKFRFVQDDLATSDLFEVKSICNNMKGDECAVLWSSNPNFIHFSDNNGIILAQNSLFLLRVHTIPGIYKIFHLAFCRRQFLLSICTFLPFVASVLIMFWSIGFVSGLGTCVSWFCYTFFLRVFPTDSFLSSFSNHYSVKITSQHFLDELLVHFVNLFWFHFLDFDYLSWF